MSERIAVLSTSYPERAGDAAGHFVESEVKRAVHAGHELHVLAPGRGKATRHGATLHWLPGGDAFGWPGALARLQERPTRALGASRFCIAAARTGLKRAGTAGRKTRWPGCCQNGASAQQDRYVSDNTLSNMIEAPL